jgi:hypothetical protein
MTGASIHPLDQPAVPPLPISGRLRSQLVYFMAAGGSPGVPPLKEGEFFFKADEVAGWIDDGVLSLISPLDTGHATEVELSEEQEALLNWLQTHRVQHVRVVEC